MKNMIGIKEVSIINKKILITISLIIIVLVIIGVFFLINKPKENLNDNNTKQSENTNQEVENNNQNNDNNNESKSVILYFSATGNTERIANYLHEITSSDIIEIVPANPYTDEDLSYNNDDCRANIEQNNDNARPEIANQIDISAYDTIYLGYPIWWGNVPKIILTLLDTYDLSGKTVIPFCTSGSTGIETSMNTLRNYNQNINWLDGERFSSSSTKTEVEEWLNSLNQN